MNLRRDVAIAVIAISVLVILAARRPSRVVFVASRYEEDDDGIQPYDPRVIAATERHKGGVR